MKSRTPFIAIALILLGGGLYWFTHKTHTAPPPQPRLAEQPPTEPSAPTGKVVDPAFIPQPNATRNILDPKLFCDRRPDCKDDPTIPNNPNELRWMQQHGYPTKEEQDRLSRLSDVELEREAKQGKLIAMTELGSRMIDRNDPNGSLWVMRAADRGSTYAYYIDAKREMNRTLGHGLVESGAHLRLAYLLGDYKAATALYQFSSKERLNIGELNSIDRRAASLYITYAKNRQPVPRPFE